MGQGRSGVDPQHRRGTRAASDRHRLARLRGDQRGGGRRLGPEPVGGRRQLLRPAEQPQQRRRCLQGLLRARLDLGACGGRARAPRVSARSASRGGSRSPVSSPGAWRSSSTRFFLRTRSRDQTSTCGSVTGPSSPRRTSRSSLRSPCVFAPYAVRPLRRILFLLILLVAIAAMYLGAGYPSDALGGLLLGIAAGAAVLVAFGSPAGRPDDRRGARIARPPSDTTSPTCSGRRTASPRGSAMDVTLTSGEKLRVDAFGRDQRDAQFIAKAWHRAMYHEPGLPVFGSRHPAGRTRRVHADARRPRRRARGAGREDRHR